MMMLDGGLATELEARGHDLHDDLWSAKVLLDAPEAVRQVHMDFLEAGADCISTITYQATLPGFRRHGLSEKTAIDLMQFAVQLAVEARDEFWSDPVNRKGRLHPLVAASIGPYGAFLSDASEYTGDYDIDDDALYRFHRSRWHILADGPADLIACETIPSRREATVLLRLIGESPGRWTWLSFSCRDEAHISDGSPLVQVARACDGEPGVIAVGVNCVPPAAVGRMIDELRKGTTKPVIVYPNSGERYSAEAKAWRDAPPEVDWGVVGAEWAGLGVAGIGGCCRVSPETISRIRRTVVG
ncbi:MAG: homocysteine S-methyltransferase [Gemmatimonadota bacterium]|nr:MAG: homocysteine S-methyltransferase [Gemmatimonadota bacterium]